MFGTLTCKWCGKKFKQPLWGSGDYCSEKCKHEAKKASK